jgi:DNA-binding transcriptional regulator YhcF (GntR family)
LLSFVPVTFDLYRPLKPRLRWAMACLVSYADHAGRCWPSVRRFAVHAGISKSAAQRDLAELEAEGHLSRKRRPGGVYVYRIARRFLPQWAKEQVSQARDRKNEALQARCAERAERGVPERGTEEKPLKKNQGEDARARFSNSGTREGSRLPDMADQWRARIGGWVRSGGKFWLPQWGPKPSEPGCFAPAAVLQAAQQSG